MRNNEDYRRIQNGQDRLPVHACLGVGRCIWYAMPTTCPMCRELRDSDDVNEFVDRLIAGN